MFANVKFGSDGKDPGWNVFLDPVRALDAAGP